ncbi:MAG: hypothetical protein KF819_39410 [Labilithrix sp.]|nr:hypothetical protein [Labilithrix sp.]
MTFQNSELNVPTPSAEAAVILGGTLGIRGLSRETPFYVGADGAASPFVKSSATR